MSEEMPPSSVCEWVERTSGGKIVRATLHGRWRPHWFLDLELPDGTIRPTMLRGIRTPGFMADDAGSRAILRDEAAVLRALQNTAVKVPRYYGYHEDDWIFMERAAGQEEFSRGNPSEQAAVGRQFMDSVLALHALDPAQLDLPDRVHNGWGKPPFGTLLKSEETFDNLDLVRPEPLFRLARWWLHANAPPASEQLCLLQGDCGPNQFMFDGAQLTAVVDWELARIGDPMEELGQIRHRAMIYPMPGVPELFQYYRERSPHTYDQRAINYHTVMWALRTPFHYTHLVHRHDTRVPEMLPLLAWDAVLRRGLCEALMEAFGVDYQPPAVPALGELSEWDNLLLNQLHLVEKGSADDAIHVLRTRGAIALAKSSFRRAAVGADLERQNDREIAEVLGESGLLRNDALGRLDSMVQQDPQTNGPKVLPLLYRMAYRHEFLIDPLIRNGEVTPYLGLQHMPI